MDWILRLLRRGGDDRAPLVCYLRENGPIAYRADLFAQDARGRAEAMLATGLAWYWKTAGTTAIARDWTELSRWSLAALLADLAAVDTPHVLVIAVEPQDSADEMTDARVANWTRFQQARRRGRSTPWSRIRCRVGVVFVRSSR